MTMERHDEVGCHLCAKSCNGDYNDLRNQTQYSTIDY